MKRPCRHPTFGSTVPKLSLAGVLFGLRNWLRFMEKLSTFLLGAIVGAALVYGSLKYHLVRANDGFHMVVKSDAEFAGAYVDIRNFSLEDWAKHPDLAAALLQADKRHLVNEAASDGVRQTIDNVFDALNSYEDGGVPFRGS